MKSFFTKITIAALLLALLLPTLCACGMQNLFFAFRSPMEKAVEILSTDINRNEHVTSYRLITDLVIDGKTDGRRWTRTVHGEQMTAGLQSTDALSFYRKETTSTTYANSFLPAAESIRESGFADGQMFSNQTVDGEEPISLASPLTAEEYLAHMDTQGNYLLVEILQSTAGAVTCEQNDADEWEICFSQFDKIAIDRLMIYFNTSALDFVDTAASATYTLRTDKNRVPLEAEFCVNFTSVKGDICSKLLFTSRYEAINEQEAVTLDISAYKNVKDLRLADQAAALFREIECSTSLSFTKSEKFYLKVDSAESSKKDPFARCEYTVTQTIGADGVTFRADITEDGDTVVYTYANNYLQTEDAAGKNPAKTISNAAASAKVYDWFNTAFFDSGDLTTSELVDKNPRFKFKSVDAEAYADRLKEVGSGTDQIRRTSVTLDVTIKDGKMTSYSYMATLYINRSGRPYVLYYETTVTNISYSLNG